MAYSFNMKVAGESFAVSALYPQTERYCRNYSIDEPGTHYIEMTEQDIVKEREFFVQDAPGNDPSLSKAPGGFIENVALLRKIAEFFPAHRGMLVHGSAIAVDGKGYLFTALSGTGKSTHTALLRKLLGDRTQMVNDDKPIVRFAEDGIMICGTPWMGKHCIGNNVMVPLCGIFFLRQSPDNELKKIEAADALPLLMCQSYRPDNAEDLFATFDMVEEILNIVPMYDFGCNMDISAAELSSSVMK